MEKYQKTIGGFGEGLAKNFLERRGYKTIETNKKIGCLEIDLITKQDQETIFVEVKTRTTGEFGKAGEALKHSQIKDLKKAISLYCYKNRLNLRLTRLDFIAIDLDRDRQKAKITHYRNII